MNKNSLILENIDLLEGLDKIKIMILWEKHSI